MKTNPIVFLYTSHCHDANHVVFARSNSGVENSHALKGASALRLHRALFATLDNWKFEPSASGGYFAWPYRPKAGTQP